MKTLISTRSALSLLAFATLAFSAFSAGDCYGQSDLSVRGMNAVASSKMARTKVASWHVFLVSVRDYNEDIRTLEYTDSDVQALYDSFVKINVPPENITILSKTQRSNTYYPAKTQILKQFDRFLDRLDSESIAFVYFSGHGFNEKSGEEEKSYFAPIDFDRTGADYSEMAICLNDDILAKLAKSNARFSWLCVDACCSYIGRGVLENEPLSIKNIPVDILFQQSCEDGKEAYEGVDPKVCHAKGLNINVDDEKYQHGLFTKSLLEALAGKESLADQDDDGNVSLSEVVAYVETHVSEDATTYHNKRQKPRHTINDSKNIDDFILFEDVNYGSYARADWEKGHDLCKEGRKLLEKGDFKEALDKIQEARKLLPTEFATDEVDALFELANQSYREKDFSLAIALVNEALVIDGKEKRLLRLRKIIETEVGKKDGDDDVTSSSDERKPGAVRKINIAGVMTNFHWCPPGEFVMGSPNSDKLRDPDETQHRVKIARGFWMGETPVTVGDFKRFVNATKYKTEGERNNDQETWNNTGFEQYEFWGSMRQDDTHPVVYITWADAQAYIKWLNANDYAPEGLEFKLPSESHWEYAARAGTTTVFWWGNDPEDGKGRMNGADQTFHAFMQNDPVSLEHWIQTKHGFFTFEDGYIATSPVGSFAANNWGLKDVTGNVWEWCQDWYSAYPASEKSDPVGSKNGLIRVQRGGGWGNDQKTSRIADRYGDKPTVRTHNLGFRLELSESSSR